MATIDDLTFQQLANALPAGSITFANGSPVINVKAITGDTYADINATGVVEAFYKLREAAGAAQATINASLTETDIPLNAFPDYSYGVPLVNGKVPVSQVTQVFLALDTSNVKGQSQEEA